MCVCMILKIVYGLEGQRGGVQGSPVLSPDLSPYAGTMGFNTKLDWNKVRLGGGVRRCQDSGSLHRQPLTSPRSAWRCFAEWETASLPFPLAFPSRADTTIVYMKALKGRTLRVWVCYVIPTVSH